MWGLYYYLPLYLSRLKRKGKSSPKFKYRILWPSMTRSSGREIWKSSVEECPLGIKRWKEGGKNTPGIRENCAVRLFCMRTPSPVQTVFVKLPLAGPLWLPLVNTWQKWRYASLGAWTLRMPSSSCFCALRSQELLFNRSSYPAGKISWRSHVERDKGSASLSESSRWLQSRCHQTTTAWKTWGKGHKNHPVTSVNPHDYER